jgi:hypothetical protein
MECDPLIQPSIGLRSPIGAGRGDVRNGAKTAPNTTMI